VSGPRVGIDGLALRAGGGVTWLVRLSTALAASWPEASIEVLARRDVETPVVGRSERGPTWIPRRTPRGAWRLPIERLVVARFVRRAAIDVMLVGADAGPARLPCPFVQASLNARPYAERGLRARLLARAARATAKGAYATAFLSQSLRRLAEPVLAPRRAVVIPAGVEPAPNAVPSRAFEPPYVLVVATGYAHKDLPTALRAVLALRRAGRPHRLVWVGVGAEPEVERTLRAIARDDPGALVVAGRVDAAALEAWYAHADALMLPSRLESGGLPVAEALARGVPVVASDIPAIAETAAGFARLHPPGDVEAASRHLDAVLASPADRRARVAAGTAYAESRSWAGTALAYRRLLEDAIASG